MGRVRHPLMTFALLSGALAGLGGCTALAPLAAIPGVVVEGAVSLFRAEEEGLPASLPRTLAAVQQSLRRMELDVDILEPERKKDGYRIAFGNERLDGLIKLKRQTPRLTTVAVRVRRGALREEAVEKAIMKMVRDLATSRHGRRRFDFRGYRYIHRKPELKSERIGWYRARARLELAKTRRSGWLRLRMPSMQWGYIKARMTAPVKRGKHHRHSPRKS